MSNTRKLVSLLLAVVLTLGLVALGFAEGETGSITINDAVVGQTYTIYQILDLESYNASANAYAYKATTAWNTFINSDAIKQTHIVLMGDTSALDATSSGGSSARQVSPFFGIQREFMSV